MPVVSFKRKLSQENHMSPGVPGQLPATEQDPIFKIKQHTHTQWRLRVGRVMGQDVSSSTKEAEAGRQAGRQSLAV